MRGQGRCQSLWEEGAASSPFPWPCQACTEPGPLRWTAGQWPVSIEVQLRPLPAQYLGGGCPLYAQPLWADSIRVTQSEGACPSALPGCSPLMGPSLPAPQGRTLLEAKMGHPLDGCVSLLHELVEADQEGLLLLPLPACLEGILEKEQEALGSAPSWWVAGDRQNCWLLGRKEVHGSSPRLHSREQASSPVLWAGESVLASERHTVVIY